MKRLLDTNAILYLLGERLARPLDPGDYYASVISEIELLSYPLLDSAEENRIRSFLATITLVELTREIREITIQIRRRNEMKTPDAIIAASAMFLDAELLSNDHHFQDVPGLKCRSLELK